MSGFSDRQTKALQRNLTHLQVRTRVSDGKELSYIEGWFAIAEANRIFGFDGWDRETIDAKCIQGREARGNCSALYTARVRITVRCGERVVVRDGCGTCEGRGASLGEAHDVALKGAETDATKRALVTFGKAFGLTLYSDQRRRIGQRKEAGVDASSINKSVSLPPSTKKSAPETSGDQKVAPSKAQNEISNEVGVAGSILPPVASRSGGATSSGVPLLRLVDHSKRGRVDKSELTLSEPKRIRDKEHLRYVRSQPCIVCNRILAEPHHVRFAQAKAFGSKVSDEFTVPMCRDHHRELHNNGNERAWWHDMGVDPLPVARRLWEESRLAATSDEGRREADAQSQ